MKIIICFIALLLAGCAATATPEQLAAAETVRMQASEAAADRELLRTMAQEYANRPAPPPVVVQPPAPNYTPLIIVMLALMTIFIGAVVLIAIAVLRRQAYPYTLPPATPRALLIQKGRGQYQIIDATGTRPLEWSNPQDVRLFEDTQR